MQTSEHPSRSAPKCVDCIHAHLPKPVTFKVLMVRYCNHPSAPVSLADGMPSVEARDMRRDELAKACGPHGRYFEPRPPVCPTCNGAGQWREPYASDLSACPDCTNRPSSSASVATVASV